MATHDLTRSGFDPGKHYTGVRMQQGRVLTDDDFNEARRIDEEERRRTRLHMIGPAGSPDDGFRVDNAAVADGQIDFELQAGTFYLGGLKLELEEPTTFRLQPDWLLNPGIAAPDAERRDLVYLEAWEQSVAAVEDEELFEVALGGPDTAGRDRLMARVRVAPDVAGTDCEEAWEELLGAWAGAGSGSLRPDHELATDTRLTVTFSEAGVAQDLCSPQAVGGYLGAENQAIRVQITEGERFTWGFDNGAPLYRALVDGDTVTLLGEPRDEAHHPLAGQILQVLPWGAVLRNGEKLAEEIGHEHFSRIAGSYDPDTRQLTLADPLPAGFGEEWMDRSDAAKLQTSRFGQVGPQQPYVFVRIWDRGDDTTSDPAIPIVGGTAISLGTTGLTVTFGGVDRRPGDYWILAARPETPDRVTPWELLVERPPHGYRRFFAPIAFIHWQAVIEAMVAQVEDCRKHFRPLLLHTSGSGCCRYTVADGQSAEGDFTSIQEAVDRLPPDGGEICVRAGLYTETVLIQNRRGVRIHGCGGGGEIRLEAPAGATGPTLHIEDSQEITVEGITVAAVAGRAVELTSTANNPERGGGGIGLGLDGITLLNLVLEARDRAALWGDGGRGITVSGCRVDLMLLAQGRDADPTRGQEPGIFLAGDDLLVTANRVVAADSDARFQTSRGGVQIAGGARRVTLRGNHIENGFGDGIVLGSVLIGPNGTPSASEGNLYGVTLADNDILEMAGSGVRVAGFFDLTAYPILIGVRDLSVVGNRIRHCDGAGQTALTAPLRFRSAQGGIVLADVSGAVIRDNLIADNGSTHLNPICGIFALTASDIEVAGNTIRGNGRRTGSTSTAEAGHRGGIVLCQVLPTLTPRVNSTGGRRLGDRITGSAAARIHHNTVEAPAGRALELVASGPVEITDNSLISQGDQFNGRVLLPFASQPVGAYRYYDMWIGGVTARSVIPIYQRLRAYQDAFGGAAVSVIDLGLPNDVFFYLLSFRMMRFYETLVFDFSDEIRQELHRGPVLFTGNQVRWDLNQATTSRVGSAVVVLSLDDVAVTNNQITCDVTVQNFLDTNLVVLGNTVRVQGNRLNESYLHAVLSSVSYGVMNSTTDNQGTHCFNVSGHYAMRNGSHNESLLAWQAYTLCNPVDDSLI